MEQVLSWIKLAIQVLSCLAVIIPLGYKLYNTVVAYGKEKNWPKDYELTDVKLAEISQLIDDLCAMAKQVNVNVLPAEGEEPVVE